MKPVVLAALLLTPEAPYQPDYIDAPEANASIGDTSAAGQSGRDPQYIECIQTIAEDAKLGRQGARAWAARGGGPPAVHCLAVADIAAGFPKLGAVRLMELAEEPEAGDASTRARIFAEAALAWLEADRPDYAVEAIDAAYGLAPHLAELHMIAAKSYAAAERWEQAVKAASAAEETALISAEGYIIRARGQRALGRNGKAAEDVVAALKLDPFNLDALVLRGELIQTGINIKARYGPAQQAPDR